MIHAFRRAGLVAAARPWLLGVLVLAAPAPADDTATALDPSRPGIEAEPPLRIGVALSGGGARGAAHVGVLRELEALGIEISAISGTSMGAVVGGLYAAGQPLEDIERALVDIDWGALFDDRTAYRELSFRRKTDRLRYRLGLALDLGRGGIALPSGLRSGQKLGVVLSRFLHGAPADFDDLPIPFRAVAADIETGEAVVLGHGDLAQSIRASLSIPGALSPVEIDGRLLVDGGIANNLPVDVVRELGVDLVIAVDVSEPLYGREALDSLIDVSWQVISILTRGNMTEQLEAADVLVVPELDEFAAGSFARVEEIIARGREAARAQGAELAPYGGNASTAPASIEVADAPRLAFVEVVGTERVDPRRLLERLVSRVGDPLSLPTVERDVAAVFGIGAFENVRFHVVDRAGETGLIFEVEEKSGGPFEIRADLRLRAGDGRSSVGATFALTRRRLNRRGGEWRNELLLGEVAGVHSEVYQPLDFAGRFFVAPHATFGIERQDLFDGAGTRVAEYEIEQRGLGVDLGWQWGANGELRLGVVRGTVETDLASGMSAMPATREAIGRLVGRLRLDTTDSPTVPQHGVVVDGEAMVSRASLGADRPFRLGRLRLATFIGAGRHTGWLGVEGGSRFGDDPLPAYEALRVGGLFSLGGFSRDRFRGEASAAGRLGYHWRLAAMPSGLGSGVYLGGVVEWGQAWADRSDADLGDLRFGATIFAAADTLLGPLVLAYGRGDGGNDRFYVALGQPLR